MRTIDEIENDLKNSITEAVVPLQTTRNVDFPALERLVKFASEGATVLKGQRLLPRSFLIELYITFQILRREEKYISNPKILETADQLEMMFGLILRGESPKDRQPGVPRIL